MANSVPKGYSAVVTGAGTATITIQPPGYKRWSVEQISVQVTNPPSGATGDVKLNDRFVTAFVPAGDALGDNPPLPLTPVDTATVNAYGCTAGETLTALLILTESEY